MAQPEPPPSVFEIDALPLDLLSGVLFRRFFERRPLLHLVSLVCKRWRRAALACITKLDLRTYEKLCSPIGAATLSQLTSLTSASIAVAAPAMGPFAPRPLHFPPSLTRLRLNVPPGSLDWLVVHPHLRRLHLWLGQRQAPTGALLAHSRTTLEELTLEGNTEDEARKFVHVSSPLSPPTLRSLPALNSLHVHHMWAFPSFSTFLKQHATQLISLGLVLDGQPRRYRA